MLVYLYICIFLLIVVTVCFIWYVATRPSPIENYKGKFPSGKIIQIEHKPYTGYYSYINIIDSLHHSYDISGGNTIPIQLQLDDIPKYGYLVIQTGTTTLIGQEISYCIDQNTLRAKLEYLETLYANYQYLSLNPSPTFFGLYQGQNS